MKYDDIEKFILDNRKDFDDVETADFDSIWNMIPKKKVNNSKWKFIIIGVTLFSAIAYGIVNHLKNNNPKFEIENFALELLENDQRQIQMVNLIKEKEKSIDFSKLQSGEYQELLDELESFEDLKFAQLKDMDKYPDKEEMIHMLYRHYERKARVLEIIIREINKNENENNRIQMY